MDDRSHDTSAALGGFLALLVAMVASVGLAIWWLL